MADPEPQKVYVVDWIAEPRGAFEAREGEAVTTEHLGLGERAARRVERGWCQEAWARDAHGKYVTPNDPTAVRWCLIGALTREARIFSQRNHAILWLYGASGMFPLAYNDAPGRTQAEVAALLRTLPPEEFP